MNMILALTENVVLFQVSIIKNKNLIFYFNKILEALNIKKCDEKKEKKSGI